MWQSSPPPLFLCRNIDSLQGFSRTKRGRLFKHLSSRQLPAENSTWERGPNAKEELLSKESGVPECTQKVWPLRSIFWQFLCFHCKTNPSVFLPSPDSFPSPDWVHIHAANESLPASCGVHVFIERARIRGRRFQGNLPKLAADHRGPNFTTLSNSASRSKANLDLPLPVCSGLLSVKEKFDSQAVWSAVADPSQHFIIFFPLLNCGFCNIFHGKLKELPSANVTTNVLYCLPQSASCERPRTRLAWRQIKSGWQ